MFILVEHNSTNSCWPIVSNIFSIFSEPIDEYYTCTVYMNITYYTVHEQYIQYSIRILLDIYFSIPALMHRLLSNQNGIAFLILKCYLLFKHNCFGFLASCPYNIICCIPHRSNLWEKFCSPSFIQSCAWLSEQNIVLL